MQNDVLVISEDSTIPHTIKWIKELTLQAAAHPEIKKIAIDALKSDNVLKYVFDFAYDKILYVPNEGGKQQLRTVWNFLRTGHGNCTIYSEIIGAVLINLGIPFKYRTVSYPVVDKVTGITTPGQFFEHVYIVTNSGTVLDPVLGQKQDGTDTRRNRPKCGIFNYELPYSKKIDYPMSRLEILQGTLGQNRNLKSVITNRSKMARYGMLGCSCGCGQEQLNGLFSKLANKFVAQTPVYNFVATQVSTDAANRVAVPIANEFADNATKIANTVTKAVNIASSALGVPMNLPIMPTTSEEKAMLAAQAEFDLLNNPPAAQTAGMNPLMIGLLVSAGLGFVLLSDTKPKKGKRKTSRKR